MCQKRKKLHDEDILPLYLEPKVISKEKKKDLLSLLKLIPPVYHPLYKSLKTGEVSDDDLDGIPLL